MCALRPTRCALSLGTLTDPAKGTRCAHLPQCNYKTLREHTSRVRTCPVAGYAALLTSNATTRDDALAAQLRERQLPLGTARVWVRGAEVRANVATAKPPRQGQPCGARLNVFPQGGPRISLLTYVYFSSFAPARARASLFNQMICSIKPQAKVYRPRDESLSERACAGGRKSHKLC